MRTDTVTATITELEILIAEQDAELRNEAIDELERYIGTVETYGGYNPFKPDYSWNRK